MINKKSNIPLYIQLSDEIREQIKSGKIKEGDKLLSEPEMVQKYGVARLTVRDALSILVNEGLLEKHHGKGTFCRKNVFLNRYRVDILLDLSDVYFIPYYMRSICAELEKKNVNIVMSDTKNNISAIEDHIERILDEGSNGVIFQPTNSTDTASDKLVYLLNQLTERCIPYVMIDTYYKNAGESYVIMDEYMTGKIAADYFMRMGHTSLCAIMEENRIDSIQRVSGFCDTLVQKPKIITNGKNLSDSIKSLLNTDITGIFCYHDGIAKKCYEILNNLGVTVGEQISVVSVDDTIISQTLSPPLTSIIHPKEHLGREAAKAILSMVSAQEKWPYKKIFYPSLAIRKSCVDLNNKKVYEGSLK